jgi:hypothetical protein
MVFILPFSPFHFYLPSIFDKRISNDCIKLETRVEFSMRIVPNKRWGFYNCYATRPNPLIHPTKSHFINNLIFILFPSVV